MDRSVCVCARVCKRESVIDGEKRNRWKEEKVRILEEARGERKKRERDTVENRGVTKNGQMKIEKEREKQNRYEEKIRKIRMEEK